MPKNLRILHTIFVSMALCAAMCCCGCSKKKEHNIAPAVTTQASLLDKAPAATVMYYTVDTSSEAFKHMQKQSWMSQFSESLFKQMGNIAAAPGMKAYFDIIKKTGLANFSPDKKLPYSEMATLFTAADKNTPLGWATYLKASDKKNFQTDLATIRTILTESHIPFQDEKFKDASGLSIEIKWGALQSFTPPQAPASAHKTPAAAQINPFLAPENLHCRQQDSPGHCKFSSLSPETLCKKI